jgi:hypothetical protein
MVMTNPIFARSRVGSLAAAPTPFALPDVGSLLQPDSCLPALGAQYDVFAAAAAAGGAGLASKASAAQDVTSALEALVSLKRERFDS